jgi:hypothetical protein
LFDDVLMFVLMTATVMQLLATNVIANLMQSKSAPTIVVFMQLAIVDVTIDQM